MVKDAAGNVVKAVEYTYDVFDRRIAKEIDPDGDGAAISEVERFVYDGEYIALTFDGGGNLTHRYLHGTGVDQVLASEDAQGEVLWALADNQGTVRDVVDATGVVVNHVTYDSFGGVTGESNTGVDFRFGYTGREFDEETGLYYYRARYYDAATGRFISQDPIGFEAGDGNLYRYVFNSPTNFNDYSGEAVIALTATVGGGLFLAAGGLLILSNPQAQEVIPQLPQRISNLFKFFDTTPNPDFDSNNINRGKTPDFLPDPLVGGGFRLGIHDFNPNDINIHDGIPVRFPDTLTFPLGDFECLFPPFFESSDSSSLNWNWKSTPTFGHTFNKHGQGQKKTKALQGRAASTAQEQGQWLDNEKAAEFLKDLKNDIGDEPIEVEIPSGLGQVISPDGTITPVNRALVVPKPDGTYRTAYPIK